MAKGLSSGYLPVSAVGVADFIVEAFRAKGGDFTHGYTYSGHPTCAAVALKNLEIIEREDLVERTRSVTGPYLAKRLAELAASNPLVGETRSLGLLGAVEIVSEPGTNKRFGKGGTAGYTVRDICIANGLMVRGVRDSIVMSPPLIITEAEIDTLVDTIGTSITAAAPALRAL
jgi:putrescine aminotransferase